MAKTYRLGVIGFAHSHVGAFMKSFAALPNIEWVACADTVPVVPSISTEPGTRKGGVRDAQEKYGVPEVYEDYREMLRKESFDIVIFCPENTRHGEVAEAIAAAGAHMITEKPMSASLSDALRMTRAVRAAGVTLAVNWPITWSTGVRKMKTLVDEGTIGDVWEVKWRNGASMGPMTYGQVITDTEKGAEWWHRTAPGGGAMLDYCCYGACVSRWMIGEQAVAALGLRANINSHYGDADDNAIMTVRFPRALALLEATWTTWNVGVPTGPIVYGTKGTLVSKGNVVEVYTSRGHGLTAPDAVVDGEPLPAGRANPAEEFIHHLETGEPLHTTLEIGFNLEAMAILDAGIRSAVSGKLELVNDMTWCVG